MYNLSTEQLNAHALFKEFVSEHVLDKAQEWDLNEEIPDAFLELVRKKNFLGGLVPKAYGGEGWDCLTYGLFNEAMGRGSSSLTVLFTVQGMVTMSLLKWAREEQLKKWMPQLAAGKIAAFAITEPEVGSDISAISTSLTKKGEQWVLSGKKQWITFGAKADVFLVFAKDGENSIACMVPKDSPGLKVTHLKHMMGFKACSLAILEFNNVQVEEENIIGKPGFALSHIAPVGLHIGRISTSFSATGLIRACLEASTKRSMDRKVNDQPINDFGMVKEMIADMGVNYEAAMQLCVTAASLEDDKSHQAINHALVAKYFASKSCVKAANDAVQIFGANGCHELSSPTARYYRDAKIMEIIEGSTQVHMDLLNDLWIKKYK